MELTNAEREYLEAALAHYVEYHKWVPLEYSSAKQQAAQNIKIGNRLLNRLAAMTPVKKELVK